MADTKSITSIINPAIENANKPGANSKPTKDTKKSAGIDQEEFLNLLVHQLEQQDPLDPLDPQDFASQLAQFTQVEQLISINGKLGDGTNPSSSSNSVSSMASFLGHEVVVRDAVLQFEDGRAQNLLVDVPNGAQSVRIDFLDEGGQVAQSAELADVTPGKKTIGLSGVNIPNGTYDHRVVAVDETGRFINLDAKVTGTVEGFVLEPTPSLLVNGKNVALEDVVEVYQGQTA